jgi:hypothetical protein
MISTKNELKSKLPEVRFNGKQRIIFIHVSQITHESTKILNEFCDNSKYTWRLNYRPIIQSDVIELMKNNKKIEEFMKAEDMPKKLICKAIQTELGYEKTFRLNR